MSTGERIVKVNGVELCVEASGDPADPAVLLIHGAGHSLTAWDEEFVNRLVAGGRRVIRHDSRDAGRSTAYPVGSPAYGLRDLVADAAALLDALGVTAAHVVGMSQGAAVAQLLALDHTDRVASLTLASGTPGGPGHHHPDLPGMSREIQQLFADEPAEPDWSDRAAVIDYLVEAERPFAARSRPFDRDGMRAAAERVVDRTVDVAAQLTNPFLIDAGEPWRGRLGEVGVPTLVFHGTEDPFFPVGHGRALAAEIPGARFIPLEGTGHEVFPRHRWDVVVPAILDHTAGR
ncbi:pimeloyl-ACP methyl ester carboxylesterase [Actinomadura pelletieri DSM 43383]|uniref:Pimeloyl-ACP methyl ester carboxylesterase n=1 Tax=Actinomadura pelletieri DSM 43383 TaxID=1120940 RepID=A0A495QZ00_9ACTN|nr:alpha/beta hydrolase [Actinomadura pelletieri]RKS79449.1 pimeloyl-ACP methyl ester carboxylesterase [Actinomadura pelletieri DSM 43383]